MRKLAQWTDQVLRGREIAQGVVEFALMLPLLALIFSGIIDFSRFLYFQTAIESAARVGAETASNPCPAWSTCHGNGSVTPDNIVIWATSCEASPDITLDSNYTSCSTANAPCASSSAGCSTPAAGTDCNANICVTRTTAGNSACSSTNQCVSVTVGYDFQPITPGMAKLFSEHSCVAGDASAPQTTLCSTSTGRAY